MKGSLLFACNISLQQKSSSQLNPFFPDLHNDHLVKNRRAIRIGRCLWPRISLLKVSTVGSEHRSITNLTTSGQLSTMHQVTILKEPTTAQSATAGEQDLASAVKCKSTAVPPKLLSTDENVLPSQVPTQERFSIESKNISNKPTESTGILFTSYNIIPNNTSGRGGLKEISDTKLNSQKFLIADEELLLYEKNIDEEMSSDLDSSLEGKLLIDESMSDEEVYDDDANDEEMELRKCEALLIPQLHKPASSSMPDKEMNKDLNTEGLKSSNIVSETQPKHCSQEFQKVLIMTEKNALNRESPLREINAYQIGSQNLATEEGFATVQDIPLMNSKMNYQTEKIFLDKDNKRWSGFEKEKINVNALSSKFSSQSSEKFFNQSDSVVSKEAIKSLSGIFNGAFDTPPTLAPNKDDPINQTTKKENEPEYFDQIILKDDTTESCGTPVQPSASPDSTTYTGEELSLKAVVSRKVSFLIIKGYFVCFSCFKHVTNESIFKRHVWQHFHNCISKKRLCIHCSSVKDSSQCPAVKKVFTMLHNSCSKEVSSLRLNLLLDTPSKNEKTTTNQAISAKNPMNDNPGLLPNQPKSQTFKWTETSKDNSQNFEYLTVFISCQQSMCAKCNKRIVSSNLAPHIYHHIHALANLPRHGICSNEIECDILKKIMPMIQSTETKKVGLLILDIAWKWNFQRDLTFRILLIHHNLGNSSSGNNNANRFTSSKDYQVLKSSNFVVPNQNKVCDEARKSNVKNEDVDIEVIECKQVSEEKVIVLGGEPGAKVSPSSTKTLEGCKKMTFVIKSGNYICTSCTKVYVTLELLKAHIMWHFHSHEKLCSISHYDGQLLSEKECPILSNIMSCMPKLHREMKIVIVYWKKNTEEKTVFKVQIIYPKKNPVIDLTNENSDDEDATKTKHSSNDNLKETVVINIDDNSSDSQTSEIKVATSYQESSENQENGWVEKKPKLLIEKETDLKCSQKEIQESSLGDTKERAPQLFRNIKDCKNSSLTSEGGFYVCGSPGCKFSCIDSNQFQNHLESLHSSETTYPCIHCGHISNGPNLLMTHMDTHVNHTLFLLYRCSVCEYATNLLPDFEHHLLSCHSTNSTFLCRFCKEYFRSIKLLLEHLTKNLLKFILCPHCSARDVYRRRMLNHIQTQHPDKPRKIVVTSQLICKAINQNKLMGNESKYKDTELRALKSKNKEDILIILDEEDQGDNGPTDGEHVGENERIPKSEHSPKVLIDNESEVASQGSQKCLSHNLCSNIETKPTTMESKYVKPSSKQEGTNIQEKKTNELILLDDHESVVCSSSEKELHKERPKDLPRPLLVELLSGHERKRLSTDNDPSNNVEALSEVESNVQKCKSSLGKKGVEEEKRKKNVTEHYTVKNSSKLPCELKIMLRRTSCTTEVSDARNLPPKQTSDSGKERNVFQLFGRMEQSDVQTSPSLAELSGCGQQIPNAELENAPSGNNVSTSSPADSVNNDCPFTEDGLDKKIKTPSLLQEVSLGGGTLDLRLQKCYSKGNKNNQDKTLICSICLKNYKTVYRIHLHLLSDHFKWPLWECQDCGMRVYSHSKITTHCWRVHKNQSPRIKSLDLPVIELNKNNEFTIVNTQKEFESTSKTIPLNAGQRKSSRTSRSIKEKPASVETSKTLTKSPNKRSKSLNGDNKEHKKKRSSESDVAPEQIKPSSTSNVGETASCRDSIVDSSAASLNHSNRSNGEQPPKKKPKTCNADPNEKKCPLCDYSCKSNLYLLHLIQEHMKEYQNCITDEEIEQVEEAITGNSLSGFACPFCEQKTKQRVDCKIHVWRIHAHLKLLVCNQCKFVTWFERHLQRHVAEDHGDGQASLSSKDKETPLIGVSVSNCPLVTSSVISSTPDSQIQQARHADKTTGQLKLLQCNKCDYAALFEQDLKSHKVKQHTKKVINGMKKKIETQTDSQKSLPRAKSSSASCSKKKSNSGKNLKPSKTDSLPRTSLKSKNTKTPTVSQKASASEKSSAKGRSSKSPNKNSSKKISDKSAKKGSDKNKETKSKIKTKKSTEIDKEPTILKKILAKPPFPVEKASAAKSSKTSKSPKNTKAEEGGTDSASLYTKSICPKTGKNVYICSVCFVERETVSDVINHWKKHKDVLYQCSKCAYKKHNRDRVYEHIKLEHQNEGHVLNTPVSIQKQKSKLEDAKKTN